jgi:hypothetical protein
VCGSLNIRIWVITPLQEVGHMDHISAAFRTSAVLRMVYASDVHEASPAAKAGLKAGDVLVEFDGKPIDNLYDFTYALRQHKPGRLFSMRDVDSPASPAILPLLACQSVHACPVESFFYGRQFRGWARRSKDTATRIHLLFV